MPFPISLDVDVEQAPDNGLTVHVFVINTSSESVTVERDGESWIDVEILYPEYDRTTEPDATSIEDSSMTKTIDAGEQLQYSFHCKNIERVKDALDEYSDVVTNEYEVADSFQDALELSEEHDTVPLRNPYFDPDVYNVMSITAEYNGRVGSYSHPRIKKHVDVSDW